MWGAGTDTAWPLGRRSVPKALRILPGGVRDQTASVRSEAGGALPAAPLALGLLSRVSRQPGGGWLVPARSRQPGGSWLAPAGASRRLCRCPARRCAPRAAQQVAAAPRARPRSAPHRRRRRAGTPRRGAESCQRPVTPEGHTARKTVLEFICVLLLFFYFFFFLN